MLTEIDFATIDANTLLLIEEGRIKPVINITTGKWFRSIRGAAESSNVDRKDIEKVCYTGEQLENGCKYALLKSNGTYKLYPGHYLENNLIKRGNIGKKVKNIVTGEIFSSVSEAAKKYKTSEPNMCSILLGKHSLLRDEHSFCYLDDFGNEIKYDSHSKALEMIKENNKINFVAWPIDKEPTDENFKYFKTTQEIVKKLNLGRATHIKSVCEGERSHVKGWRIAYYNNKTNLPDLKNTHIQKPRRVSLQITEIDETNAPVGEIFLNCRVAAKKHNVNHQSIESCCKGKSMSVLMRSEDGKSKKIRFRYIDKNGEIIKTGNENMNFGVTKNYCYLVKIENEQYRFSNIKEMAKKTGLAKNRIMKYLSDKTVSIGKYEIHKI